MTGSSNGTESLPTSTNAPLDRFIVLSLLEDMHVASVPDVSIWLDHAEQLPSSSNTAASDEDVDDSTLLTAGSAGDEHEESSSHKRARCRALRHLSVLATRLGPRWAAAEIVPYLLRCVEEDDAELSRAVATALPLLLRPSSSQSSAALELRQVLPVLTALCATLDPVTRELASVHTIPLCFIGVSLVEFVRSCDWHSVVTAAELLGESVAAANESHRYVYAGGAAMAEWHSLHIDEAAASQDAFDRTVRLQSAISALQQWTSYQVAQRTPSPDAEAASAAGPPSTLDCLRTCADDLVAWLCSTYSNTKWVYTRSSIVRAVAVIFGAVRHALTSHAVPQWHGQPADEDQLQSALCWLVAKHVAVCFGGLTGSQALSSLLRLVVADGEASAESAALVVKHNGALQLRIGVAPTLIASTVRALPLIAASHGSSLRLPHMPTFAAVCALLEKCLLQDQLRVSMSDMRAADAVRAYAQRHDDGLAGRTFQTFHAICDTLWALLRNASTPVLSSEGSGAAQRTVVKLLETSRLLFARGSNYSSWRHRFFTVRRSRALFDALGAAVSASTTLEPSPTVAALQTCLADPNSVLQQYVLQLQKDVVQTLLPSLCGDCEVEVRCAVAFHAADALLSAAATVMSIAARARVSSAAHGNMLRDVAKAISALLLPTSHGIISAVQVCAMDCSDRVRAAATSAIAGTLILFSAGPSPIAGANDGDDVDEGISSGARELWNMISTDEDSCRVVDALVTILMDLFHDESNLVQLSVMQNFGDVIVMGSSGMHPAAVDKLESEVAKLCSALRLSHVWRVRESFASLVCRLIASLLGRARGAQKKGVARVQSLLNQTLLPMAVDCLFDAAKAVRDATLATLVLRLREALGPSSSALHEFVNETLWPLILQHPRAESTYLTRSTLLRVAVQLQVDPEHNLQPLLDKLSHDSVANVRLVVAKEVHALLEAATSTRRRTIFDANPSAGPSFEESIVSAIPTCYLPLLRGLLDDVCADVRECASAAIGICV